VKKYKRAKSNFSRSLRRNSNDLLKGGPYSVPPPNGCFQIISGTGSESYLTCTYLTKLLKNRI